MQFDDYCGTAFSALQIPQMSGSAFSGPAAPNYVAAATTPYRMGTTKSYEIGRHTASIAGVHQTILAPAQHVPVVAGVGGRVDRRG